MPRHQLVGILLTLGSEYGIVCGLSHYEKLMQAVSYRLKYRGSHQSHDVKYYNAKCTFIRNHKMLSMCEFEECVIKIVVKAPRNRDIVEVKFLEKMRLSYIEEITHVEGPLNKYVTTREACFDGVRKGTFRLLTILKLI